ncbi:MAG: glycosyltransferase [Bacteroides sp.]|nr:glycosyltransferase [Roseburia sp.]MCM1346497.1 glycosyltransferase [Bacteroides sp.]MCM1421049.1 glycosyltransferase [Bacteroides sp.]
MKYSIVIPVYNRPDEADELLESLARQSLRDFEIIVVEDGSAIPCKEVVERYIGKGEQDIKYYSKKNSGPGLSRNYGVERAGGEYVIILDSDCVLPEGYMAAVDKELSESPCDAFGGPDCAHPSFTPIQKAISYSMTSFFTTGGIRGGKKKLDKFYPRSFNMGVRRDVYEKLGGFSKMRFGEDIDFSIRIFKGGYTCRLFPEAWVWHKRRTDLDKFFKQVFNSGIARINLQKRHPGSMKLVHLLPAVFTVGVISLVLLAMILRFSAVGGIPFGHTVIEWWILPLLPLLLYVLMIFIDASRQNHSMVIGFLAVEAAFVQLFGYGFGFLKALWERGVMKKGEFAAYEKNFYD